ncbi:MAG TPA: hypothetical protein VIY28_16820, partial [Pseudonocardiaceae bacterium]
PVDWTGYGVTFDNPSGQPPYRSPRITLSADGTFVDEVRIDPRAISRFTIELTDAAGTRQKLSPDTLSITHSDVEFGGAVLTSSLGIGQADGTFAPMLRKGTALPASTRETYRTSIALRRSDSGRSDSGRSDTESVIRIPVVEGERARADRNLAVGMVEIRPKDVRIDLPAGSDVEVTFEIDKSRLVTVVVDVPLVQEQFEAEMDLSNVRPPSPQELQRRLANAEARLTRLRGAPGSGPARGHLAKIEEEGTVENTRNEVRAAWGDLGAAAVSEKRLRDLNAQLDDVEDAVELPRLLHDLQQVLDDCADLVGRSGDAADRRELADLQSRARTAIRDQDPVTARTQLDRARELLVDLWRRTDEWDIVLFNALRAMRAELQPTAKADSLIREGERAIAQGDRAALGGVNERLRRLVPSDRADLIGGVNKP